MLGIALRVAIGDTLGAMCVLPLRLTGVLVSSSHGGIVLAGTVLGQSTLEPSFTLFFCSSCAGGGGGWSAGGASWV